VAALTVLLLLAAPALAQLVVGPGWSQGPGAAVDNTLIGAIDLPGDNTVSTDSPFLVAGWVVDRSAQGWAGVDGVQVFNGLIDGGGSLLASGIVGQNRPDVAGALGNGFWAASGFSVQVPGTSVQPGITVLSLYVHTPARGWWYRNFYLSASAVSTPAAPSPAAATAPGGPPVVAINLPAPGEQVLTQRGDYVATGSAYDPQASRYVGSGIDRVEVYLDGERGATGGFSLGVATISGTDWSLSFTPVHYVPPNHSILYVYAHSKITGKETLATREFYINTSSS